MISDLHLENKLDDKTWRKTSGVLTTFETICTPCVWYGKWNLFGKANLNAIQYLQVYHTDAKG